MCLINQSWLFAYYFVGEMLRRPVFNTSYSNIDRVKILHDHGGIYLDLDSVVIRPMGALRRHECVLGLESPDKVCSSVILGSKNSTFLKMWLNSYLDDYRVGVWAYNSGTVPFKLAMRFPELVHLEATSIQRPNYMELKQVYAGHFNWREKYTLHLNHRLYRGGPYYQGMEMTPSSIRYLNSSYGEIARWIYYGDDQEKL